MRMMTVVALLGAVLVGCDGGDKGTAGDRASNVLSLSGDAGAGETVYADNCAVCHAADGSGGTGPSLLGFDEPDELVNTVLDGKESMPSFADQLEDQDIADVLAFVETL